MSSILESIKSVKNPFTSDEPEPEPDEADTTGFFTDVSPQLVIASGHGS